MGGPGLAATAPGEGPAFYHFLVDDLMQTLGATAIPCGMIAGAPTMPNEQTTCAALPGFMFGYFEMGVHGRLYAFLEQGRLRVRRPWSFTGTTLNVAYDLGHGDVLNVARVWSADHLYAVFTYVPANSVNAVLSTMRH